MTIFGALGWLQPNIWQNLVLFDNICCPRMTTTKYLTIFGAIWQYLVPWDDHNQIFDHIWCYLTIFDALGWPPDQMCCNNKCTSNNPPPHVERFDQEILDHSRHPKKLSHCRFYTMPPPSPPGDLHSASSHCSVLVEGACQQSGWLQWTPFQAL